MNNNFLKEKKTETITNLAEINDVDNGSASSKMINPILVERVDSNEHSRVMVNPIVVDPIVDEMMLSRMINPIVVDPIRGNGRENSNKIDICKLNSDEVDKVQENISAVDLLKKSSSECNKLNTGNEAKELSGKRRMQQIVKFEKLVLLEFSADDIGNADRFDAVYEGTVKFDRDLQKFYTWNGKCWIQDNDRKVKKMAEHVMRKYREVAECFRFSRDSNDLDLYIHSKLSCNNSRLNSLVDILKHRYAVPHSVFDAHPALLNVANGVVNLKTGHILPHDKKLFLTTYIDIAYIPGSECYNGEFVKFLISICCGDSTLAEYMQRCFGYGITGETKEQVFFLLYGTGGNGKTTLIEAIGGVVEPHVKHLPIEVILNSSNSRSGGSASPELAQTTNARLLFTSESNDGDALNEGKIKNLTGQSAISVRQLYCEPFEFTHQFKIFMDTNFLPHIKGNEYSVRRRIKVIPFNATFKGVALDKYLPQKLKLIKERECILAWLVAGAVKYYSEGLGGADVAKDATTEYLNNSDSIGRFVNEAIVVEIGAECSGADLYEAYAAFCNGNGLEVLTLTSFGRNITQSGISKKRTSQGIVYENVRLM